MSRLELNIRSVEVTTLCLLVRGNPPREVLLGFKKVGFGAGKLTGFGGKVKEQETIARAAVRELEEETGIRVREEDLQPAGELTFLFPANPSWSQTVHVFVAEKWDGIPRESEEMTPIWFPANDPPFEQMWQDGRHWLPPILAGQQVHARFVFGEDNETIDEIKIEMRASDGQPGHGIPG
jgi:8-oxo-dGTP pyrophosphatase MutT (NUDIX family)